MLTTAWREKKKRGKRREKREGRQRDRERCRREKEEGGREKRGHEKAGRGGVKENTTIQGMGFLRFLWFLWSSWWFMRRRREPACPCSTSASPDPQNGETYRKQINFCFSINYPALGILWKELKNDPGSHVHLHAAPSGPEVALTLSQLLSSALFRIQLCYHRGTVQSHSVEGGAANSA